MHYGLMFPNQSLANARLGSIESERLRETYGETVYFNYTAESLYIDLKQLMLIMKGIIT